MPSAAHVTHSLFRACTALQAQQQFFEQHLAAVNQQNVELRGEVAALRKQLASLAGRRSDFLWL